MGEYYPPIEGMKDTVQIYFLVPLMTVFSYVIYVSFKLYHKWKINNVKINPYKAHRRQKMLNIGSKATNTFIMFLGFSQSVLLAKLNHSTPQMLNKFPNGLIIYIIHVLVLTLIVSNRLLLKYLTNEKLRRLLHRQLDD